MAKKKKKSNLWFMILTIVVVIGGLATLTIINKHEQKQVNESLPTQKEVDALKTEKVTGLDVTGQPMQGEKDAPVTVVKFGDFKCPACKQWEQTVYPQFYQEYVTTGKVKFYFVNYAFLGRDSWLAGAAGEIIYKQNPKAFWQYYKTVYKNQGLETNTWATESYLTQLVKENVDGIDLEQFKKDLHAHKYLKNVKQDYVMGSTLGVQSTPSLMVEDTIVSNSSYASLKAQIETALKSKGESK